MKIQLNKSKSKSSVNINNSLTVNLVGDKRLIPDEPLIDLVDEYEQYRRERSACTQVRLTCAINTICTNVLFNNVSEIIKNEGSSAVTLFNKEGYVGNTNLLYGGTAKKNCFTKESPTENLRQATRDTQLSREEVGYKYHCGIDIFNNYTLRTDSFKAPAPPSNNHGDVFNTLADWARDFNGEIINYYKTSDDLTKSSPAHVFLGEEIANFKIAVANRLIEENGWLGFKNVAKFPMFKWKENEDALTDKNLSVNKYDYLSTLNYQKGCDFIDLAPERDLFSFVPKYNSYKRRVEKNWNYCITYPSSSTTKVSFIDVDTNGLKAIYYDDSVTASNGKTSLRIYSISKHGLEEGDIVNIYIGTALKIENAEVLEVEDDYIFDVYANGEKLSKKWVILKDKKYDYDKVNIDDKIYHLDGNILTDTETNAQYYVVNDKKVNVDDDAQFLSYKRVVNNTECKYYVRIFSRLPNWKFVDRKPTRYELYKEGSTLIHDFNGIDKEFENQVGQLAFARNIYSDKIGELVFSDTLDIDNLRDNLGRPISSLYLTIVKNNKGYREWYGKAKQNESIGTCNYKDDAIEYSHMFGKNSCAFKLSVESLIDPSHSNVLKINNLDASSSGLNITSINERGQEAKQLFNSNDEIEYNRLDGVYDGDRNFYGDLCCYNALTCEEQSIQPIDFRFNTAQREVDDTYGSYSTYGFDKIIYDEIKYDDYDNNDFETEDEELNHVVGLKEGYYYEPHYEIPIRTFSETLESAYPIFYKMKNLTNNGDGTYTIKTWNYNSFQQSSEFFLYDKESGVRYDGNVTDILGPTKFKASISMMKDDRLTSDFIHFEFTVPILKFKHIEEDPVTGEKKMVIREDFCGTYYKMISSPNVFAYCLLDGKEVDLNQSFCIGGTCDVHTFEVGLKSKTISPYSFMGCFKTLGEISDNNGDNNEGEGDGMEIKTYTSQRSLKITNFAVSSDDIYISENAFSGATEFVDFAEQVKNPKIVTRDDSYMYPYLASLQKSLSKYLLFVKDEEEIPDYATFVNDGSCRYYWRTILQNGFNQGNESEEYPFTNNHIYINKNINLFLKRQGCEGSLCNLTYYPYAIDIKKIGVAKENDYANEDDITC